MAREPFVDLGTAAIAMERALARYRRLDGEKARAGRAKRAKESVEGWHNPVCQGERALSVLELPGQRSTGTPAKESAAGI